MKNYLFTLPLALLVFLSCSAALSYQHYDAPIKNAAGVYLPFVDWRLYKAQLIQESRLDPKAVSPAGAAGIAQFMPGTWKEYQRAFKTPADAFNPGHSIQAGAWYMHKLRKQWRSPRPEHDRHNLAAASYNAGLGNILKAQAICGGALLYRDIIQCLPDVTGHHSKETIQYNQMIWRHYISLLLGG